MRGASSRFKAVGHEVDHGQVDHRLAAFGQVFVIFTQAAVGVQPSEGALAHVGRMDQHPEDQPEGVDEEVALAAVNLLGRVIAPFGPPFLVVLTDGLSKAGRPRVGVAADPPAHVGT